jgi:hypothetical protein
VRRIDKNIFTYLSIASHAVHIAGLTEGESSSIFFQEYDSSYDILLDMNSPEHILEYPELKHSKDKLRTMAVYRKWPQRCIDLGREMVIIYIARVEGFPSAERWKVEVQETAHWARRELIALTTLQDPAELDSLFCEF